MKNLIITSFLVLFVMSATANNKVGDKLFKMTESLKNESKLKLEEKCNTKSEKKLNTKPPLCNRHYYITCTNCWGETIALGSVEEVYWCDSGVMHHVNIIEVPEFEGDCYSGCW